MHLWHAGFYTFSKRTKAQFILEFEDLALSFLTLNLVTFIVFYVIDLLVSILK